MANARCRTICWMPIWNKEREGVGLEHLLLAERVADSVVLAFDEEKGPFRLTYRLAWDESWQLRDAELAVAAEELPVDEDGIVLDYPDLFRRVKVVSPKDSFVGPNEPG